MLVFLEMVNFPHTNFECSHSVYDPAAGTAPAPTVLGLGVPRGIVSMGRSCELSRVLEVGSDAVRGQVRGPG